MCIGVPGQVLSVGEDIHQLAQVEVCGIKRDVNIPYYYACKVGG